MTYRSNEIGDNRRIVILIEAIDMLEGKLLASKLKYWLPRRLPQRIRLVVTVNSANSDAMEYFRSASATFEDCPQLEEEADAFRNQIIRSNNHALANFSQLEGLLHYEKSHKRLELKSSILEGACTLNWPESRITDMLGRP